jgi:hypothetical protein
VTVFSSIISRIEFSLSADDGMTLTTFTEFKCQDKMKMCENQCILFYFRGVSSCQINVSMGTEDLQGSIQKKKTSTVMLASPIARQLSVQNNGLSIANRRLRLRAKRTFNHQEVDLLHQKMKRKKISVLDED